MKARHRKSGGMVAKDVTPKSYTAKGGDEVTKAAKARKSGGKAVDMHGMKAKAHGGRMPRKSGGRAGSNMNPLSSAAAGTPPKGHRVKVG